MEQTLTMEQSLAAEFLSFLDRYLSFYRDFLALEKEKYDDIAKGRIDRMDGHVKKEEAFLLRSRGLEQERDRLAARAGNSRVTFRELIPQFGPLQGQAQQIYDELSRVLLDLKEMNIRCNYLTQLRLHRIQSGIKKMENQPELQKQYNEKAREGQDRKGFLSKKV